MAQELKTHFGLGAEAIQDIHYDYDGPNGCQRKFVLGLVRGISPVPRHATERVLPRFL
jgi:hypothetical protein